MYQNRGFHLLRLVINPYYEKEFKYLSKFSFQVAPQHLIDIGGNLGQSTLAMRKIFNAKSITIFEPNVIMAAECRSIKSKRCQITVNEIGLGVEETEIELFTPAYNGITFWGLASLNKEQLADRFGPHNVWRFKLDKLEIKSSLIKVRTLDSYDIRADFIKIDVEGSEIDVLLGAMKTIIKSRPIIMVECTGTYRDVKLMLESLGYINYELNGSNWVESRGSRLNQIFVHTEYLPHPSH
jgi:FkbM family methyltransferase